MGLAQSVTQAQALIRSKRVVVLKKSYLTKANVSFDTQLHVRAPEHLVQIGDFIFFHGTPKKDKKITESQWLNRPLLSHLECGTIRYNSIVTKSIIKKRVGRSLKARILDISVGSLVCEPDLVEIYTTDLIRGDDSRRKNS